MLFCSPCSALSHGFASLVPARAQEAVLRQGDENVRRKDAQMKTLRREIATLRRKIEIARRKLPSLQVYAQTASTLQKLETELAAERQITAALCVKLENPSAAAAVGGAPRCRQLQGL